MKNYDYIFVGFGVAARTLLCRMLMNRGFNKRVLVIDSKQKENRKFTYWIDKVHIYSSIVDQKFDMVQLLGTKINLKKYWFESINISKLYKYTDSIIKVEPNITVVNDKAVNIVDGYVKTVSRRFQARIIFDSRSTINTNNLLMHDSVWLVKFDQNELNTSLIVFLDLLSEKEIKFIYLIPRSKKEAEIHLVNIGGGIYDTKRQVFEYLTTRYRSRFIIKKHSESIIDLEQCYPRQGNIIPIGARAGWVKPTTGYGFVNILKETEKIVEMGPENYVRNKRLYFKLSDQLMLRLMKNNQSKAVCVLKKMANSSKDTDMWLGFLNEDTGIKTLLKLFGIKDIRKII